MPLVWPKNRLRHTASLAALMLALLPGPAWADPVSVRVGERGAGARLVFEWSAPVTHTARLQDNTLRVTFARAVETDLDALVARLPGWVRSAKLAGDGRTLLLQMARPATVASFVSGNRVVLDLGPVKAAAPTAKATAKPVAKPMTVRPAEKKPLSPPAVVRPAPKPDAKPAPSQTTIKPVIDESNASAAPAPAAAQGEGESAAAPPQLPAVPTVAASSAPPSVQPSASFTTKQESGVEAPPPQAAPVTPVTPVSTPGSTPVATSADTTEVLISTQVPVAAFVRGSSYYVVVNESAAPRTLTEWVGPDLAKNGRYSLISGQGGRVLRYEIQPDDKTPPRLIAGGTHWRLLQSSTITAPDVTLDLVEEPAYALGPRVLVKTDKALNPVVFADPVVGDTLIAVPVAQSGAGLAQPYQFVQARLLPSTQGVAVLSRSDDLAVISSPLGVEISAGSGFKLAETLASEIAPADPATVPRPLAVKLSLPDHFNFAELGSPAGADFTTQREALQMAIVTAATEDKPAARRALAQFYFINGMPTEAVAAWQTALADQPALGQSVDLALLRVMAAFSSGTLDEAKALLAALTQPSSDATLWRAYFAARQRDWPQAAELFGHVQERLWDYPDPYRRRLALAAIETALQSEDYTLAQMLIDKLKANTTVDDVLVRPALDYLLGIISWNQKNEDDARARLNAAVSSWNQYWRVRAELALVDADAKGKDPNLRDLIRRTERLRYAWRGDALEFDVLHRLTGLHLQAGDYAAAFDDYAQLVEKFPLDPRSPTLKEEQRAAFTRIFQDKERDRTPAYMQLAIWDRFPEFRPTQPEVLDEVRRYLADRVAGIDLLDRAAGFYQESLAGLTDPLARAEMGVRIAGLKLLDRKGEEAARSLADTEPPTDKTTILPEPLRDERRVLKARAIFEQGQPDEALRLLTSDYGEAAMRLRADITWRTKRWAEAAAVLEALIGPPPAAGQPLSDEQASMILNRATALALAGDRRALGSLRVDYGEAMASTAQAATFQLITRPDVAGGLPDRKTLSGRMAEVDLFGKVLERYRQSATDSRPAEVAAAPATAPAQP